MPTIKLMDTLCVLYKKSSHGGDPLFLGKSAFDLCRAALEGVCGRLVEVDDALADTASLVDCLSKVCLDNGAKDVLFAMADSPFMNCCLSKKILQSHKDYHADFTRALGYPVGLSPVAISSKTLGMLATFLGNKDNPQAAKVANSPVSSESLFDAISLNINEFEIEDVISNEDHRFARLHLDCSTLHNTKACVALFSQLDKMGRADNLIDADPDEVATFACSSNFVLKTVPTYIEIQLCSPKGPLNLYTPCIPTAQGQMSCKNFDILMKAICKECEQATISLSPFSEPLEHDNFCDIVCSVVRDFPAISVIIETNGVLLTKEICKSISDAMAQNGQAAARVVWIVDLDATTVATYSKIRGIDAQKAAADFEKAQQAVLLLQQYFPNQVYAQFTRGVWNEGELEQFYRGWTSPNSGCAGNCIIQKPSTYCGLLPDCKSIDLSPVGFSLCYHSLRDLVVLWNGDVLKCRYQPAVVGNFFDGGISLFDKTGCKAGELCGGCDDYYTFNF